MEYLHRHAGYTRGHNPITGNKDLQRLPGLVAIAYQHETSRCGDPHLHTHVIVPNRQPRADGHLVSLDSKSLYHEAKAAGIIYQATLRHLLHAERGFEFHPVDLHTGMAEIAGVDPDCIAAWSRRSTRLREWARNNLVVIDGAPTAAQLAAAQKATRPTKPESLSWAELKAQWRTDARGLHLDRDAHLAARAERRTHPRSALDHARTAEIAAHIDKPTFTRADMVELLGAQLPIDAPGEPRAVIEQLVDDVGVRISAPREAHQREGSEKFTLEAIIAEEEQHPGHGRRIRQPVPPRRARPRPRRPVGRPTTRDPQHRGVTIPGAARCRRPPERARRHSLKALRAAAHRARKEVLVLAPTGKAVDEAMAEGAGDRGLTVAKALQPHREQHPQRQPLDAGRGRRSLHDRNPRASTSCSRAPSRSARKWCWSATPTNSAPVKARGGMFEQLCADLPWSQRLGEVWRMAHPEERDTSLALRSAHGNRLRTAITWYRDNGRLHSGDPIAMASDALDAYLTDRNAGKDALLVCDTWEMRRRTQPPTPRHPAPHAGPTVTVARDQQVSVGDIVMSRKQRHHDCRASRR